MSEEINVGDVTRKENIVEKIQSADAPDVNTETAPTIDQTQQEAVDAVGNSQPDPDNKLSKDIGNLTGGNMPGWREDRDPRGRDSKPK
ncbi:hypothetical protein ACFL2C_03695 [Patescibacteria group bacterium]